MVFSKNKIKRSLSIKINNHEIKSTKTARFLGIHFHCNLDWSFHLNEIFTKCENHIRTISCLRRTWWGADPNILLNLYKSIIQSRIEYGSFVFNNLNQKQINDMIKIQTKAIRAALGYMISTPINVILAEAKTPPIHIRRDYLGLNYISKVFCNESHQLVPILEKLSEMEDRPTACINKFKSQNTTIKSYQNCSFNALRP